MVSPVPGQPGDGRFLGGELGAGLGGQLALRGGHPGVLRVRRFNGRTRADNAPEAMLSLVAGMAVPSGLRPSVTQQQRSSDFPYVVPA